MPDQIAVLEDFGRTMEGRHAGLAVFVHDTAREMLAGRKLHLSQRDADLIIVSKWASLA
jgi:hypothetical protein